MENKVDPQELISKLKQLIEKLNKNKQKPKDGNELKDSCTPQN